MGHGTPCAKRWLRRGPAGDSVVGSDAGVDWAETWCCSGDMGGVLARWDSGASWLGGNILTSWLRS